MLQGTGQPNNMAPFTYKTLEDLQAEIVAMGLDIPTTADFSVLGKPLRIGRGTAPNRLADHPMEGCDGEPDGRPSALAIRRYERFASGGAGIIWVEACAVVPEGKANPRQLQITRENLPAFADLIKRIHTLAAQNMGQGFKPYVILQLTHSGRYSKPHGTAAPIIAHHSIIDARSSVTPDTPLVSDEYLDALPQAYARSAALAAEAGFDAVDVKACHRYLLSELLASFTRSGRYGGSYENRTRLMLDIVRRIRADVPAIDITPRLNVYDALPQPFGWGVAAGDADPPTPDLAEPLKLVATLVDLGIAALSVTLGNPYFNPHFNRPYDRPVEGMPMPPEHPLIGVQRHLTLTRTIQQAFPALPVMGAGFTWLRQFFPNVAAAAISKGWATATGQGRGGFAYPDFPKDILNNGRLDSKKVCTTCSGCTQIMRDGGQAGCIVRDAEVYMPIYRAGRERAKKTT